MRSSIARAVALAIVASLFFTASAQLSYHGDAGTDAEPKDAILCSPGAIKSIAFFYKGAKPTEVTITGPDDKPTWLAEADTAITNGNGNHNITALFVAKNDVGVQNYVLKVVDEAGKSASIEGVFICAGICIQDDAGKCISSDDGAGVQVGASGSTTYKVKAVDVNGGKFDASSTTVKSNTSPNMLEVDVSKTKFIADTFTLALNEGRYGSGEFILTITNTELTLDGETFDTILICKQIIPENPLCYAKGGEYEIESSGQVRIPMYNLEKPPRKSPVKEVGLVVGGSTYDYSTTSSSRKIPTQEMVFSPLSTGEADLVCDGVKAYVNGNGKKVVITGNVPEKPKDRSLLAKFYTKTLDRKTGFDILDATIIIKDSHPDLFLKSRMDKLLKMVCDGAGTTGCVAESLTAGSVVMGTASYTETGNGDDALNALRTCMESCECQKKVNEDCDKVVFLDAKVQAGAVPGAGGLGVSAGLATWTIVLIAVVGAFAIILLIMLALWAVYRRNAEQSESDYSSSGPLGVPDPSDLLYEQSIVRDIYGRGDFPEGGPSAAAAAERAREADLREEFPRPPSSSGVSRAAQTDDASSTYSV